MNLIQLITNNSSYNKIYDLILKNKVNINFKDKKGNTALMYVCSNSSSYNTFKIIKLLINFGANVNLQNNNGNTALMFAVRTELFEIVQLLIKSGADVNLQNKAGNSVIHFTSTTKMLQLLIKLGVNINKPNGNGYTLLMLSILQNNIELIKFLLQQKDINIDFINSNEISALILAKLSNNLEIINLLKLNDIYQDKNELILSKIINASKYSYKNKDLVFLSSDEKLLHFDKCVNYDKNNIFTPVISYYDIELDAYFCFSNKDLLQLVDIPINMYTGNIISKEFFKLISNDIDKYNLIKIN
jgi:hypothetical protein